jgi:toxin ParE1/3/4
MRSWHLRGSRNRTTGGIVRRPRHFLIYRVDDDILVIGRILHDAMELRRHIDTDTSWR